MKFLRTFILTVTAFAATASQAQDIAFTNANVITMAGDAVVMGATVVVSGDRIAAVGTDIVVPPDAMTIDAAGKYLMPGLGEMHGHVPRPDEPAQYTEDVLFLYVANGITTVRGMLGAEGQLELRRRANSNEIIAPTLYLAGPSFSGGSINSPEEAIAKARRQKDEGWNLLKIHPGLTMAEYDAMAATARELGIRFGGHVPAEVGLMHAIDQGQETFDHVDGYVEYLRTINAEEIDADALAHAVNRTIEAGAWVVPTMALWQNLFGYIDADVLDGYAELKYMPPGVVQGWSNRTRRVHGSPNFDRAAADKLIEWRLHVLGALHRAGAPILFGTDAPQVYSVPGFSLHRELPHMVEAGMDPYAILVSGTINVGKYFANEDAFGTITAGSRADLILVDENPLEDVMHLARLSGVMVRGQWLSREALDAGLMAIASRYAQ